eukprot:TRINITY_DN22254_c0_g2_i2.p1 TRINITY_DN22254_c0_g2~~TRINITY_DN22254_c0_g2_i2.p1  ORF type:complete len:492 (-),score=76.01 TRINITY_DN22254_c0_g2_i2:220-1695(-)
MADAAIHEIAPGYGRHLSALNIDHGSTAFMFLATALVQFMTPGLGFFYAGMVNSRSAVQLIFQSFCALGFIFTLWIVVCFSMTFGEPLITIGGWNMLGSPWTYFMLRNVEIYVPLQRAGAVVAAGFPGMLFMAYQAMFAVITPALISGAFVDRVRFGPYLFFITWWLFLVYVPLGYWNWGGGWMFQMGAWDFAGGMVVHESAGFSCLGSLLCLGPRAYPPNPRTVSPHSVPLVVIGTALLWFGWFGFNGGSALAIGGLATIAFVNTQIAPATSMLTWVLLDWYFQGQPSLLGACSGAVAGLVVITPCAGFVQPSMAMLAGVGGGIFCWNCTFYNIYKSGMDDACDTVGVHGVGGFLGTILVGSISDPPECAGDNPPDWCANPGTCVRSWNQLRIQSICAVVSAGYAAVVTYFMLKTMMFFGMNPMRLYKDQFQAQDWQEFHEACYRFPEPVGAYSYLQCHEHQELEEMNLKNKLLEGNGHGIHLEAKTSSA